MSTSAEPPAAAALYRLIAWLSPSFPTGAFSYSHGIETEVADGRVRDRATLQAWIAAIVAHGSGRIDADILAQAWRAGASADAAALAVTNGRGAAYRATAELALESAQQGAAFLATYQAAWADEGERPLTLTLSAPGVGEAVMPERVCHAATFGAAAARAGIALEHVLLGYLQAFVANLVSAGIRLGIVGQTDGQRILAALEPAIAEAASTAMTRETADFGSATFAADLASMAHETQYTRLFRS